MSQPVLSSVSTPTATAAPLVVARQQIKRELGLPPHLHPTFYNCFSGFGGPLPADELRDLQQTFFDKRQHVRHRELRSGRIREDTIQTRLVDAPEHAAWLKHFKSASTPWAQLVWLRLLKVALEEGQPSPWKSKHLPADDDDVGVVTVQYCDLTAEVLDLADDGPLMQEIQLELQHRANTETPLLPASSVVRLKVEPSADTKHTSFAPSSKRTRIETPPARLRTPTNTLTNEPDSDSKRSGHLQKLLTSPALAVSGTSAVSSEQPDADPSVRSHGEDDSTRKPAAPSETAYHVDPPPLEALSASITGTRSFVHYLRLSVSLSRFPSQTETSRATTSTTTSHTSGPYTQCNVTYTSRYRVHTAQPADFDSRNGRIRHTRYFTIPTLVNADTSCTAAFAPARMVCRCFINVRTCTNASHHSLFT